jgi:hypothetical protein
MSKNQNESKIITSIHDSTCVETRESRNLLTSLEKVTPATRSCPCPEPEVQNATDGVHCG